jgi:hypothetical protein
MSETVALGNSNRTEPSPPTALVIPQVIVWVSCRAQLKYRLA